jgi:rotatin
MITGPSQDHQILQDGENFQSFIRQSFRNMTRDALGVNHVTEPASTASHGIIFILSRDVLAEICCYGMTDSNKQVQECSRDILQTLLQSQLLIPAARWQQLMDTLTAIMPLLQAFCGVDTTLGKCLLGLLDTKEGFQTGGLPNLEKFRGVLRLMYIPETRIRAEALGRLAYVLSHEEKSLYKLPLFSELDVTNLANLMMVENPRVLDDEDMGRSVFQEESLKKVYDIFASDSMDGSVRKSAADQLAIMLQDKVLHTVFKQYGGVEMTVAMVTQAITKSLTDKQQQNALYPLLPSLVKILRHLIQHDFSLRHKLAHKADLYYTIVRCKLSLHKARFI